MYVHTSIYMHILLHSYADAHRPRSLSVPVFNKNPLFILMLSIPVQLHGANFSPFPRLYFFSDSDKYGSPYRQNLLYYILQYIESNFRMLAYPEAIMSLHLEVQTVQISS